MEDDVKARHTPGPWNTKRAKVPIDGEFDYAIIAQFDGKPLVIAEAFARIAAEIRPDAEANACLIAASPKLLRAAQVLVAHIEAAMKAKLKEFEFQEGYDDVELTADGSYKLSDARLAIASALGES